jgi:hypothetical protein
MNAGHFQPCFAIRSGFPVQPIRTPWHSRPMTGVTAILIKLGVRFVVFSGVFWIATRKNPSAVIRHRWAIPLIALVFAVFNTSLYAALTPILNLATLGAAGFLTPFVVNLLLLLGTIRVFQSRTWIEIEGVMPTLWIAGWLTLAHGAIYFALDYLPNR